MAITTVELMRITGRCETTMLIMAGLVILATARPVAADGHSLSVYGAVNARDRAIEILRDWSPEFQQSYLYAVALARPIARGRRVRWEFEGQLVRHSGMQHHWEVNLVPIVRWLHTPWDRYVDTRLAVGWGLSMANEVPPIEPRQREPDSEDSTRIMSYNLVEIELAPPGGARWSGFVRLHHRSGVGGFFGGVEGGSNFIGLGLRYHF